MDLAESAHWQQRLTALGACADAMLWVYDIETFAEAWRTCERGDWMLWLIGKTIGAPSESAERKRLVRVACQCARLALPHVKAGETRPVAAIEMAERWARSEDGVTLAMVRTVADAAIDAAADAGLALAEAATAAFYAAKSAFYATYAANATATAVDVDTRARTLKTCADLVRAEYGPDFYEPDVKGEQVIVTPTHRHKSIDIAAMQWTGANLREVQAFMFPDSPLAPSPGGTSLGIREPAALGLAFAEVGAWIVPDYRQGRHRVYTATAFDAEFEPIPAVAAHEV